MKREKDSINTSHFPLTAKETARAEQVLREGKRGKRRKRSQPLCGRPCERVLFNSRQSVLKCYKCISAVGHAFAWLTSDRPPALVAASGRESELMLKGLGPTVWRGSRPRGGRGAAADEKAGQWGGQRPVMISSWIFNGSPQLVSAFALGGTELFRRLKLWSHTGMVTDMPTHSQ